MKPQMTDEEKIGQITTVHMDAFLEDMRKNGLTPYDALAGIEIMLTVVMSALARVYHPDTPMTSATLILDELTERVQERVQTILSRQK